MEVRLTGKYEESEIEEGGRPVAGGGHREKDGVSRWRVEQIEMLRQESGEKVLVL